MCSHSSGRHKTWILVCWYMQKILVGSEMQKACTTSANKNLVSNTWPENNLNVASYATHMQIIPNCLLYPRLMMLGETNNAEACVRQSSNRSNCKQKITRRFWEKEKSAGKETLKKDYDLREKTLEWEQGNNSQTSLDWPALPTSA